MKYPLSKFRLTKENSPTMQRRGGFDMFLKGLICIAIVPLLTTVCIGGELNESKSFFSFIRSVDPQNKLGTQWNELSQNPCLYKFEGVKCNLQATSILEIRLENLNLSGVIDADALCKLQNLQVLSLARNLIHGTIPRSISSCTRLRYLNLSSNSLSGRVPWTLTKLKYLKSLDISNNHLTPISPHIKHEFKHVYTYSKEPIALKRDSHLNTTGQVHEQPAANPNDSSDSNNLLSTILPIFLSIGFLFVFLYYMRRRDDRKKKEKEMLTALKESPLKLPSVNAIEEVKPEDKHQELVFFVEDHESFTLDDLLEASADLQNQSLCSNLYKVILKNNTTYAVKRLKKLQVSFEEFGQTMRQIGNLKHRNILPLVGYNCTEEEKLLFYKYQNNGSLLNFLQEYIEGKRDFPWRLRLTIASGIARGLAFIYQSSKDEESIPHGNLKLSNILLGENMEPLISEYGISRLLDPKKNCLFAFNGYIAPEKCLSEQGDVFSFGVILLELLTGKTVEKTGVDLPKWVRSMVREEWTGEVFDKEVTKTALQWAFPLLNVALKCVSHSPQDRPTASEVLEKIDEALFAHEDRSVSSMSSWESGHPECCILHSVIPETWDTPGSNY
ncbi:probable inactive receptor kinase At2g26730 [Durio zibethinus]|uniref:Probable inactive receptor kinase At2g26730 n=1 Tax=Durio zibethinus TaxID=66656 RepID=A0A6P5WNT5_DURZI|nr:probable inactive receptor kinase At2g26730 [Durio zibethinus]